MRAAKTSLQRKDAQAFNVLTPIDGFLDYFAAIARRDIGGVLDGLADELAQEMLALRSGRDFDVFFELWCDSESVPFTITNCWVYRDFAVVETRRDGKLTRTGMALFQRRWRICREDESRLSAQGMSLSIDADTRSTNRHTTKRRRPGAHDAMNDAAESVLARHA